MDIYAKNLEALSHVDPELEEALQSIKENQRFEVYLSEGDNLQNANIFDHEIKETLYGDSPLVEVGQNLRKFEKYDNYPILYFFGIGNGALYKLLLENKKHQRINVYEPEIELLYIVLNLYDFSKEIYETRFVPKLAKTVDKGYFIKSFTNTTKYFIKSYDFHIYNTFYNSYKDEIDRINKDIISAFRFQMYVLGNDLDDTLIGLRYSLKNIPKMLHTPAIQELIKQKNSNTAILVSTGPSLTKQLKLLKSIEDYVTILCVDSSFPILAKAGIKPDMVFSMERGPLTAKFYRDTPKEFHKDVLFMLATVSHADVFASIHGQICLFMRPDSYNVSFNLPAWGYLGGGQSTAHFAYHFAMQARYENFIFIGQDLSYGKDGLSHASNHVYGEDFIPTNKTVEEVEAYGGEGTVPTIVIWRSFLNSFVDLVGKSPFKAINATEGGVRIPGTIEMSFKEVCEKIVDKSKVKKRFEAEIPSSKLIEESLAQFENTKSELIGLGEDMFLDINALYKEVDTFLYDLHKDNKKNVLQSISLEELDVFVSKMDTMKENFNKPEFLEKFSGLFKGYAWNHEVEVASVYVMKDTTELEKKEKSLEWIKVHHEWLQRVGSTLEQILSIYKDSTQEQK